MEYVYEALKYIFAAIFVAMCIVGYLLINGCSDEGAGFRNTGRQPQKACMERDSRGNEIWRTCQ